MSSPNFSSSDLNQDAKVPQPMTDEKRVALRERIAQLPTGEEVGQMLRQLRDGAAEIQRLCRLLLDEHRPE